MNSREENLHIAEVIGVWVTVFTILIGGVFAVIQYVEFKEAQRIDRALEFIDRYQSNGYFIDARIRISQALDDNLPSISEILKNPDFNDDELSKSYNAEILKMVDKESLGTSLEQLFNFYEQSLMCKDMGLCEAIVLESFIDNDAGSYTRTFYPFICSLRKEWNNPDVFVRVTNFYIASSEELCS
ncbi:MAG: hypothetical protein JKY84_11165 [Emcibacteraceae bacterium]|nr:hypothetical protein [Emcibacteraceae bacterium]